MTVKIAKSALGWKVENQIDTEMPNRIIVVKQGDVYKAFLKLSHGEVMLGKSKSFLECVRMVKIRRRFILVKGSKGGQQFLKKYEYWLLGELVDRILVGGKAIKKISAKGNTTTVEFFGKI